MKKIGSIFNLILLVTILVSSFAQAQERERKISPQARGTIIGAGAGALGGALIHKRNRAVGGVVGGVVGGAAGYAVGKHKDNKNKEAARVAAANRAAAERRYAANRAASRRSSTATKKAYSPAKEVVVVQQAPALAYAGYAAGQSGLMYDANGNPLPNMSAYLPNPAYGDRSKPYSSYEYRRKSW